MKKLFFSLLFWTLSFSVGAQTLDSVERHMPAPAPTPRLSPFGDGEYWILLAPLRYRLGKTDLVITIPKGFVTDLASVPRAFWSIFPKTGKYMSAAILHDYLYAVQACTKPQADLVLKMEMELFGVPRAQSFSIYQAVDKRGDAAWQENSKLKKAGSLRVIPSDSLDELLAEELDSTKSWQTVKKGLLSGRSVVSEDASYLSDSEAEIMSINCQVSLADYSKAKK